MGEKLRQVVTSLSAVVFAVALIIVAAFALMSFASDDYESINIGGTVTGFTSSKITATAYNVRKAFCSLETARIRYKTDGSAPSGTDGHLLEVSSTLTLSGYGDIVNFRAISTTAVSGVLRCSYWK